MKVFSKRKSVSGKIFSVFLTITAGILILDQFTKIMAEKQLSHPVAVIPCFFNLILTRNTGAAWGILSGQGTMLLVFSVFVLIVLVFYVHILAEGWTERYCALSMIAGGILGNAVDRIWRGAVVDFLDFYAGNWHWPAFNVADSAICVGVFIFIISSFARPQRRDEK